MFLLHSSFVPPPDGVRQPITGEAGGPGKVSQDTHVSVIGLRRTGARHATDHEYADLKEFSVAVEQQKQKKALVHVLG